MKKIKLILLITLIVISVICIAAILYFAVAGRKEAARFAKATEAFQKENYTVAYPLLREIVGKDPSNAEAFQMLGAIDESKHNYPAALQNYQQARGLSPLDPKLKAKYLEMLSAVGDFQTLLNTFQNEFKQNKLSPAESFCYLEALVIVGKTDRAETALKHWKGPKAQRGYLNGLLEFKGNQSAAALKSFRNIPEDALPFPAYCRLLAMNGAALQATGNATAAEEAFRRLAAISPQNGNYLLALFYRRSGQTKQYLKQLEKTVKENPQQLPAVVELAELYTADKNIKALSGLIRRPQNRIEVELVSYIKAMQAFLEQRYAETEKALTIASTFADRPLYQAIRLGCLVATKNINKLPACVNALLRTSPSPDARAQMVDELRPLLVELIRKKSVKDAFLVSELILSISDRKSSGRSIALEVQLQKALASGNASLSIEYAMELLKANPKFVPANLAMGNVLLADKRPQEALTYFRRIPANNTDAALGEASACIVMNRPKEAEKALRRARKFAPENLDVFQAYAAFLIQQKRGKEIGALASTLPDTDQAHYLSAYMLARNAEANKDEKNAQKYYRQALAAFEKMPSDTPAAQYQLAYLYATTGQDAKAEPIYEKLLTENSRLLPVLLNLSEVKAALGKQKEALDLAKRAIRIAPDSPDAQQCLRRREQHIR